jgi:hypothetical protein
MSIVSIILFTHDFSLAVIINEHLMEALRRLRRGSANTSVDRRLVTNILLTFLCTPREDTKRFEMLGLLASILSWSDEERVRAGLRRLGNNPASSGANSPARPRPLELDKTDETEVRGTALPERDDCAKELFSHSPVSGWSFFLQKRHQETRHLHR